jgi:aspartate aminotransferase
MKMSPENSEEIQTMLKAFRNRRDMFFELLSEIPGIKLSKPAGAFYMFPEIKSFFGKTDGETTINNSDDLCLYLLDKAHVACVGGAAFGNDECIRLSYATSEDKLREAAARIKEALSKLK